MKHAKESGAAADFFYKLYLSYIPNKRDNVKQIIVKIFFLLSLAVLIVSAGYLTNYFLYGKKQESIIEKSRTAWYDAVSTESDTESAVEIMTESNSDFKGWITVPGTKIDNPFFQTTDNEFYLTHNQDKQKSTYGALFLDCSNTLTAQKRDKNLVIYGHHMKNGSMFSDLEKFKKKDFWEEHKTFSFNTLYEKQTYEIIAVFKTVVYTGSANEFKYFQFSDAQTPEQFDEYIAKCKEKALYDTGVSAEYGDKLITLSTCEYSNTNGRLVLVAKIIVD